ncbi:MAG: hypothetical protein WA667_15730 [Candidatus Nitrosopolaris sp.]
MDKVSYVIPRKDEEYVQNREDYAEALIKDLFDTTKIRTNAEKVI